MKRLMIEDQGSSAVEFAITIPIVLFLLLAGIQLCYVVYAMNSLHWTVEQSARCASISQRNTTLSCGSMSSTKTYAVSIYKGPNIGLTTSSFTTTNDTTNRCRRVAASATYVMGAGFLNVNAPVSATACFPADTTTSWPS